jgi:hypothetical protein
MKTTPVSDLTDDGPRRWLASVAPSPLLCTTEDLLRLAIEASARQDDLHALCASPAHVRAICSWIANVLEPTGRLLADELAVAQGIADTLGRRVMAETASAAALIDRLVTSHQEADTLRRRLMAEQARSTELEVELANLMGDEP